MTYSHFLNVKTWWNPCALMVTSAICCSGFSQVASPAPNTGNRQLAGQSVITRAAAQQDRDGTAGGFVPPHTTRQNANSETPLGGSRMIGVAPRNANPGQIQNFLKPLPESVFDQTTNGNRDGEKQIDETAGRLELIVENYPNGDPRIRRYVTQDEKGNYYNQGPWQLLGKLQEVTAEGEFDRGRMTGQWKRLHNKTDGGIFSAAPFQNFEGPFRSYADFHNGKLDGVWKIADRYDQTIFEMPYSEGIRHGTATWYHPNSEKMREISFKRGVVDGMLFEWNEQQEVIRQEEFIEGRKVVKDTQFFAKDKPLSQNFFLDGKLQVDGEDDWWKAKPATYVTIGTRVQHGPTGTWYQNGQPQMRGQFEEGLRQGIFIGWHSNGQKDVVGRFEKDVRVGKWTWWHSNGFKSVEGEFDDSGVQIGEWIWWNEDGTVRNRRDMDQAALLRETNDREQAREPSDSIIDSDEPEINPQRDQPEEVKAQELPEKNDNEGPEISDDIIPLDEDIESSPKPKTEATESEGEQQGTDSKPNNSTAEEIEALPDDTKTSAPSRSGTPTSSNPISDPFGDQKSS